VIVVADVVLRAFTKRHRDRFGTGRVFLPAATIAKTEPSATPGGRPHVTFVPGSLKLLVLEPTI
jgi:hypothetical protein